MLVNRVKDEIASELVHNLYAQITSLETLLRETDDVASRRRELMEQLSVLNRGIGILNEIRDTGILAAPPTGSGSAAAALGSENSSSSSSSGSGSGGSGEGYGKEVKAMPGGGGGGSGRGGSYYSQQPAGSSPGPEEEERAAARRGSRGDAAGAAGAAPSGVNLKGGAGVGRRSLETHASSVPLQVPPRLGSASV